MKIFLLLLGFLAMTANAASVTQRPIEFGSIQDLTEVNVLLDPELSATTKQVVIIDSDGVAVYSRQSQQNVEYMRDATVVAAPKAADTVIMTVPESMIDGDYGTSFQPVTAGRHVLRFSFKQDIFPTSLSITTSQGTIRAVTVMTGKTGGDLHTAFANALEYGGITLPGERSRVVELRLDTDQSPLAIAEISMSSVRQQVSFTAQPDEAYTALFDEPVLAAIHPEYPKKQGKTSINAAFGDARTMELTDDFDGVPAADDNCSAIWNPKQQDYDNDTVGDVCDNCPVAPNVGQEDKDGDSLGDVCGDDDEDGVVNGLDNCPVTANRIQEDEDKDGMGNLCDDTDSRFTAHGAVLWISMTVVIAALLLLALRVFKK